MIIFAQVMLLASLLGGAYVWYFGWQSPWRFDLAWDEEVQLHDSRIITVHIRRSYERRSLLSRWDGERLGTHIRFDAGPPFGLFNHQFAQEDVALIDQDEQVWYFVTIPSRAVHRQGEQMPPFWTLQPGQPLQPAARGDKLPPIFTRWNVMPAAPATQALASFDNTRLALEEKMRHWAANPRADNDEVIRLRLHNHAAP